eukprot:m51a1_g12912 hypothetical protein (227) ;mRNA; r:82-762
MSDPCVGTLGDVTVRRSDARLLDTRESWLNDALVGLALERLNAQPSRPAPGLLAVLPSAAFMAPLLSDPREALAALRLPQRAALLVPVSDAEAPGCGCPCAGTHWSLLAFSRASGWAHYDTLAGAPNARHAARVARALGEAAGAGAGAAGVRNCERAPRQGNAYDCGALVVAECHVLARVAAAGGDVAGEEAERAVAEELARPYEAASEARRSLRQLIGELAAKHN